MATETQANPNIEHTTRSRRRDMPIPSPGKGQDQKGFISSCMASGVMRSEFSDPKQRAAVCYSKWRKKHGGKRPASRGNPAKALARRTA